MYIQFIKFVFYECFIKFLIVHFLGGRANMGTERNSLRSRKVKGNCEWRRKLVGSIDPNHSSRFS